MGNDLQPSEAHAEPMSTALAVVAPTGLEPVASMSDSLPDRIAAWGGSDAADATVEFLMAAIPNRNTREAYARASRDFVDWCDRQPVRLSLRDVGGSDIGVYLDGLASAGKSSPTIKAHLYLAATTVNGWLRVLKTMFADATIAYDLPRDPSARVPARSETGDGYTEDQPNCLTAPQLALLLDTARRVVPRRWFPLFATLGFTAMRVGEATALKWPDISEGTGDSLGIIRVCRSHWRGHVGTQKTGKRIRSVPVPKELAAILADHQRALEARAQDDSLTRKRLEGALRGLEAGWVFPNDKGGPTAGQVVRKPWLKILAALKEAEASGVDRLTVHGLPRTMNNLLRQVTHGEVVRAVTGHVTERMTEHYSDVSDGEKATAIERALLLLRQGPPKVVLPVGPETPPKKNGR